MRKINNKRLLLFLNNRLEINMKEETDNSFERWKIKTERIRRRLSHSLQEGEKRVLETPIASEKLGRGDLDQLGKVFRIARCARLHRQMRSTENSSRTIRTNPFGGMYHFTVDAHD